VGQILKAIRLLRQAAQKGGLAAVVFYRDYMVNFSKGNQKGKSDEKTKNSKKHGGTLEDDPNAGRKKKKVSGKHSGTGEFLYGLRRRKGKPENVERVSEDTEEYSSTTRFLESSLGIKSYAELASYLAKGVERVMAELIDCKPTVSLSANFIKMPLESFSRHGQTDTGIEMSLLANIILLTILRFLSC